MSIPNLGKFTGLASLCKHCGEEIAFDDWCYIHIASGWADCGVMVSGGEKILAGPHGSVMSVNPNISKGKQTTATPIEEPTK